MARLFRREYHEHSNSWHFKSSITKLNKNDLSYRKFRDENGNFILKLKSKSSSQRIFPVEMTVVLDQDDFHIIDHTCSECEGQTCRHYLSILYYGYHFMNTDMLTTNTIQTYQTRIVDYHEYWQRIVLNSIIQIQDLYSNDTDKVRFYFSSYQPMHIRIISMLLAKKEFKDEDLKFVAVAEKQMMALSLEERNLLIGLQEYKCAYSRKNRFFSVYKNDLSFLFPLLKNLEGKIFIKETGDKLEFSKETDRLNFSIHPTDNKNYILQVSQAENISAFFIGRTTFILRKNTVSGIHLPFKETIASQIFNGGFIIQHQDLVYLYAVVAKQLGLLKCYLDFDESIEIPEIYNAEPKIVFILKKANNAIYMKGLLEYDEEIRIPMSVIRFPAELIRYDQGNEETWFYIPPQIKYQIFEFVDKLPNAKVENLTDKSELIFEGSETIEELKKVVFEHASDRWIIELSEELKKEFVYRVKLTSKIQTRINKRIDWFDYDVTYQLQNVTFTHEELKQFFKTKEKFLKLDDGRLLFIENKSVFEDVEQLLKKSDKDSSESYRLSVYNIPYLFQLSQRNEAIKIFGDNYLENMFENILARKLKHVTTVPSFLRPIMRSYQKAGYHWLKMLESYHLAGVLADDMGLGKTIQAISILTEVPENTVNLVLCPKTLLYNWAIEIEKFNRNLHFAIYEGSPKERAQLIQNSNIQVFIASYSIIQNDLDNLKNIAFHYLILDEAQHIKNPQALRTKAVKKLTAKHRIALSGTPVENHPQELLSIMDFLMPGYLPTMQQLKKKFSTKENADRVIKDTIRSMVSPFILRRKKKDVLIELPDKQEQITYCKMTSLQEKLYLQILEQVKHEILDDVTKKDNYLHVLSALTKLRQVCNHPHLVENDIAEDHELSGKTDLLKEIISEAVDNEKKILVFSQFVQMLKLLRPIMQSLKIPYEYMDGSTKNRQKVIDNFNNNNKIKVFLISLKTGGYGLNLTAADTVIIVDPWWNPMGENQAIDRAHRIGQTKKVNVYKIITKGTVEEKIIQLQQDKKDMFAHLIEGGEKIIKSMTVDQLKRMMELS